ncbi:hypothetical protein H0O01_00840 [Candidatus Micrarchaeota archaeon]|nr:hypothetical protein [Candidatus Micrarchaeota archaeon]
MANNEMMRRMAAQARRVGAVPQRRGDIIDCISPQERAEIRRVLAEGENVPVSPERVGVCHEEDGRHDEAGHKFRLAAIAAKRKDFQRGLALIERAVRNFALAGNEYSATSTLRIAFCSLQPEESERMARRLAEFCEIEAGKAKKTLPHRAGGLLKVASCLLDPFDYAMATMLKAKGEILIENAKRTAQSG